MVCCAGGHRTIGNNVLSCRAATTSSVLVTLDSKIESISAQTAAKRASQEEHDKALQAVLKEVTDRKDKGGNRKGTIDRDSMLMDVDDILEQTKGKNRKFVQSPSSLILADSSSCTTEPRRRLHLNNSGNATSSRLAPFMSFVSH